MIAIETHGRDPSVVIMDDGLQNPAVAKDLSIALVDGKRGIGNGEVIPAGPLRALAGFPDRPRRCHRRARSAEHRR